MGWIMSDPNAFHQLYGHDFGLGVEDEIQRSPVDSVGVRGSPRSAQYSTRVVWSISRLIGSGKSLHTASTSPRCAADSPGGRSIPARQTLPRPPSLGPICVQ